MKITELLDRPIAFHRVFVTLTGSVKAAIMLSQAVYWQPRAKQADGWWYKTADEWEEETGLTRHEQDQARKDCAKYLKSDLRGIPATLYWHVDEDALQADLFGENVQTSLPESGKQDARKQSNINKNTETTTENKTGDKKSLSNMPLESVLGERVLFDVAGEHAPPIVNITFGKVQVIHAASIDPCGSFYAIRRGVPGKGSRWATDRLYRATSGAGRSDEVACHAYRIPGTARSFPRSLRKAAGYPNRSLFSTGTASR